MDGTTKARTKNGYKDDLAKWGQDIEVHMLQLEEVKAYRMLAARLNCIAQDDPSIQYAAKEVCRKMAQPHVGDFQRIKKLVRFMKGIDFVKWEYRWQEEEEEAMFVTVNVDSDWVGCERTRRSTSGGVLAVGRHPLRCWSATQPTVAMSSAEAELISMTDGAARGLGFATMLHEMNIEATLKINLKPNVEIHTDSVAAKAFASTRGLGKMRHLDLKYLWIQEQVQRRRLMLTKVSAQVNVADVMTKFLDLSRVVSLLATANIKVAPIVGAVRAEGGC